jgi:cytochrome P450 family 4
MSASTITPDISVKTSAITVINLFITLLVPATILFYIYWRISRRRLLELAERIPGPKGYPVIGNLLDFIGTPARKLLIK